ncbi:MAG: C39 family peptidase, partial [Bacilli bacterium]|nr:C39 family peptidase [Bacilli bacterium]
NDDISIIYSNEKYNQAIKIDNIDVFEQKYSCGYAVIEMFSKWDNSSITEKSLYDTYGKVVTSTGKLFEKEMNKQFKDYKTTMHKYLKNTEMIDKIYNSLSGGIPVPFEWSAKYKDEWTLHYSLVTGIDIKNDTITIANPYGYYETLTLKEFIERTSFNAYKNMPLFLKLGFAMNIFEKNTIFIVEKNN